MLAPLALYAIVRKASPRAASRIASALRVTTYLATVSAIGAGVTMHTAKADVAEEQVTLGRDLLPLADLLQGGRTVLVNGERAHVATVTSDESLETVIDRFAQNCSDNASPLSDAWKMVPGENRNEAHDAIAAVAITRELHENEGTVMCMVRGKNSRDSFIASVQEFAKTGDLGAIGQMRYAYAKRGADGKTFVMTAWTDDTFSVRALTPKNGEDAPGSDSDDVPRPANAQRLLTTGIEEMPFVARAYKTTDAPGAVLAFYDLEMRNRGWSCVAPEGLESVARTCEKDSVHASIAANAEKGATLLSISESRD
ncbi:MAG: hypothetical protein ACRELY_22570 [Polyangiaceae bacterium]